MEMEAELAAVLLSPHPSPTSSLDPLYQRTEPTRLPRLSSPRMGSPTDSTPYDDPYSTREEGPSTRSSNNSSSPIVKRRKIDLSHTRLTSLVSDTDFIAKDYVANPGESRTPRTIFDDFEQTFMIGVYLATLDTTAALLLEVFSALELVVLAGYPIYHTCKHRNDYSALTR